MLQSVFLRSKIQNVNRSLPVLKKSCRTFQSAKSEANELKCEPYTQIERYRVGKKYKKNFIENLFLGLVEPEVLEYPQIRTLEEIEYLKKHAERANHLMLHGIECKEMEKTGQMPKEIFGRLQEKDLVGMKIKTEDEGLGYLESESYYIQESLSLNSSLSKIISENENSGYQILSLLGTDTSKDDYILKFLKGECVSCLAHLEHESWVAKDTSPMSTTAVQQVDGSFVISGRKTLVNNANCSDILIVSARVVSEKDKDSYTLFIVDKNSKGLSVLEPLEKFSLRGAEISDIVLDKVVVSPDNVIGGVNEGDKIIDKLIAKGKLSNGGHCIGVMRKLVNEAITHCVLNDHFKKPLHTYKYMQGKIGEIIHALYAAESMTYLMTGRVDEDPDLDVKLESIIVKIFNSEALNFILYNYMHLVGRDKCNDELLEGIIRDSPFFTAFDDPNTYLKLVLATIGVNYTLNEMSHKTVKEYKPKSSIKLKYLHWSEMFNYGTLLEGYLHLTLSEESRGLSYCVAVLNFLTEFLILKHKSGISAMPYCLSQLSELVMIIYQLTAVLGRASRSYCIGLRHSECEIRIARNIARNSAQRTNTIKNNVLKRMTDEPIIKNVYSYASACGKFSNMHPAEPLRKMTTAV